MVSTTPSRDGSSQARHVTCLNFKNLCRGSSPYFGDKYLKSSSVCMPVVRGRDGIR